MNGRDLFFDRAFRNRILFTQLTSFPASLPTGGFPERLSSKTIGNENMKKQTLSLIAVMLIAVAAAGCQSTDNKTRDWGNNRSDAPSRSATSQSM